MPVDLGLLYADIIQHAMRMRGAFHLSISRKNLSEICKNTFVLKNSRTFFRMSETEGQITSQNGVRDFCDFEIT